MNSAAPNYDDPTAPGYGQSTALATTTRNYPAVTQPFDKPSHRFVLANPEPYTSIYGYGKHGIKVYKAGPNGRRGDYMGFIKEEPVPGENGEIVGCVYYTKDHRLKRQGNPRFYKSPEALLFANGMEIWKAPVEEPVKAIEQQPDASLGNLGDRIEQRAAAFAETKEPEGFEAKDLEADHATALQPGEPMKDAPDVALPDPGPGPAVEGTSEVKTEPGPGDIGYSAPLVPAASQDPMDQGIGDHSGGKSDALDTLAAAHTNEPWGNDPSGQSAEQHPADLDKEPSKVQSGQRVKAVTVHGIWVGRIGTVSEVLGDAFKVTWDRDTTQTDTLVFRDQVDFIVEQQAEVVEDKQQDQGGVSMQDQQGFTGTQV